MANQIPQIVPTMADLSPLRRARFQCVLDSLLFQEEEEREEMTKLKDLTKEPTPSIRKPIEAVEPVVRWNELHDYVFDAYRRAFGLHRHEVLAAIDDICCFGYAHVNHEMAVHLTHDGREFAMSLKEGQLLPVEGKNDRDAQ